MDLKSVEFGILKRGLAFLLGLAAVALNKKLGLSLGPAELAALSSLVLGYIAQSALTKTKAAPVAQVAADLAEVAKEVAEDAKPDLKLSAGK
jgi:hypothetical protein